MQEESKSQSSKNNENKEKEQESNEKIPSRGEKVGQSRIWRLGKISIVLQFHFIYFWGFSSVIFVNQSGTEKRWNFSRTYWYSSNSTLKLAFLALIKSMKPTHICRRKQARQRRLTRRGWPRQRPIRQICSRIRMWLTWVAKHGLGNYYSSLKDENLQTLIIDLTRIRKPVSSWRINRKFKKVYLKKRDFSRSTRKIYKSLTESDYFRRKKTLCASGKNKISSWSRNCKSSSQSRKRPRRAIHLIRQLNLPKGLKQSE